MSESTVVPMRYLLKRLTRMVIGYGAIQWAGPFLSLIFTPIVTRILTPADYGVVDYLSTTMTALSTLTLLSLPQALTIHFNDRPEDVEWQRAVTGSAFVLVAVSSIIVGVLLFVFAPLFTSYVSILAGYTSLIRLIAISFIFGLTSLILTTSAQSGLRVRWGMVFSLVTILGTVLGNVLFVVVLRLGVTGMVLTPIFTGISLWLTGMILVHGMIGWPSLAIMRLLFMSGIILLPMTLSGWVLQVSDRLFLGQYITQTDLGHYAIANKIASLVAVAMGPIVTAWTPLALAVQNEVNATARYVTLSRYFVAIILLVSLGVGTFSSEILLILTRPTYLPAAPYVGFLTYVYVFGSFGTILTTGALIGKQLAAVTGAVVTGAAMNLLLNMLLIPSYGIWGASIATVTGYMIPQIILYLVLQKRFPIPYPIAQCLSALVIQLALLIASMFVSTSNLSMRIVIKSGLCMILPIYYLWVGIITHNEIRQSMLFIQKRIRLAIGTV